MRNLKKLKKSCEISQTMYIIYTRYSSILFLQKVEISTIDLIIDKVRFNAKTKNIEDDLFT